ncbi:MAG: CbtA family protein [Acidimicrobiales bacterium]
MRRELTRGALAGAAGGAVLAVVLLAAGEGPLQRAIDREGAGGGDELVSRAGQRVGGVVAALLVGIALGVALAFVAEVRAGRARPTDPDHGVAATQAWMSSVRLAGVAFLVVNLVPLLKYPPNPPGVGDADTIGTRTGAFLALVAWSLLVAWAAGRGWRWLRRQDLPIPLAAPAVTVAAAILVGLAYLVLPAADSPNAIPAADVWSFRIATLAGWAAYWAVAGTVLGWLRLPAGVLTRARFGGARSPA